METKKLLTVKEVAQILSITVPTVHSEIKKGNIPVIKIGNIIRIKKEEIDKILEG